MSKKGIEYAVFGILNETTGTYSSGRYLSPVAGYNGSPNAADVKDYGDNRVVETDKTVTGGTLSVELNHDDDDIYAMLLGHTRDAETGEIVFNADDVAPYVGTGAIGKSEGEYVARFYNKVQFAEPSDDNTTKQENTTFNHVTLEGDILIPEGGDWKKRKRFNPLAAAKAWLNELVNISASDDHVYTEAELDVMSVAEIKAIAAHRQYAEITATTHDAVVAAFLTAQNAG